MLATTRGTIRSWSRLLWRIMKRKRLRSTLSALFPFPCKIIGDGFQRPILGGTRVDRLLRAAHGALRRQYLVARGALRRPHAAVRRRDRHALPRQRDGQRRADRSDRGRRVPDPYPLRPRLRHSLLPAVLPLEQP